MLVAGAYARHLSRLTPGRTQRQQLAVQRLAHLAWIRRKESQALKRWRLSASITVSCSVCAHMQRFSLLLWHVRNAADSSPVGVLW